MGAGPPGLRARTGGFPSPGAKRACRKSPGPAEALDSALQTTWTTSGGWGGGVGGQTNNDDG